MVATTGQATDDGLGRTGNSGGTGVEGKAQDGIGFRHIKKSVVDIEALGAVEAVKDCLNLVALPVAVPVGCKPDDHALARR